jgi:hypothetical protein
MTTDSQASADLLFGVPAISRFLKKTQKATYHRLERKQIPGAFKLGWTHVLSIPLFNDGIRAAATKAKVAA